MQFDVKYYHILLFWRAKSSDICFCQSVFAIKLQFICIWNVKSNDWNSRQNAKIFIWIYKNKRSRSRSAHNRLNYARIAFMKAEYTLSTMPNKRIISSNTSALSSSLIIASDCAEAFKARNVHYTALRRMSTAYSHIKRSPEGLLCYFSTFRPCLRWG